MYTRKTTPIVFAVTGLLTTAALAEEPTLMYVDDDGPRIRTSELGSLHNPYASIKQAVQASQFLLGDVEIRICDGVYAPDGARVGSDTTIDGSYKRVVVGGQILLMHSDTPGFSRALLDGSLADPDDDKPFFIVDGESDVFIRNLRMTNGKGEGVHGKAVTVVNSHQVFIEHCKFENNNAPLGMGALHFEESRASAYFCSFENNGTYPDTEIGEETHGAVTISRFQEGYSLISDCQFEDNTATFGSAVWASQFDGNAIDISRCEFNGNTSIEGGAIFSRGDDDSRTRITNSLFTDNTAVERGGAVRVNSGRTMIVNVTMTENDASEGGAVFYAGHHSLVSIGASILWDNAGASEIAYTATPSHSVADSLTSPGTDLGDHSGVLFDSNPRFINASTGNYRLADHSPAIDAGDARHLAATVEIPTAGSRWNDLDRRSRIVDSPAHPDLAPVAVDMGCYERDEDSGDESLMCSPADIAPPLGVLDITDVLEFLTSYGSGCP